MKRQLQTRPAGIILLVVLSMLTFFSLLVAAYLVFSSQARQTSFALSTRTIKAPNPNMLLDEALMTIIRGTDDPTHPFFGEDLLSDLYGRNVTANLITSSAGTVSGPPGSGFAEFRVNAQAGTPELDDIFANRVITTVNGDLKNTSFRVIRSISRGGQIHGLIVQLPPSVAANDIAAGVEIRMNGVPRSAAGIGFNGTTLEVDRDAPLQPNPAGLPGTIGLPLQVALQPNHFLRAVDKQVGKGDGDFNEGYDAPDFNNWFLSYKSIDLTSGATTLIPSFHRPAVINYILNERSAWTDPTDLRDAFASLSRATFRPIPIARGQFGGSFSLHNGFTGGNQNYALRTPILVNSAARLDHLARVLTGSVDQPWDVDNDGDGHTDSIWIDIGLPVFVSSEGKLLKPLVAPMIEDLSGRLNINAIDNAIASGWEQFPEYSADMLDNDGDGTDDNPEEAFRYGLGGLRSPDADWAGTRQPFASTGNRRGTYKGLGFGPAEIRMPATAFPITAGTPDGTIAHTGTFTDLLDLVQTQRYRHGALPISTSPAVPGVAGADAQDTLRFGSRTARHSIGSGYGASVDPFGRAGTGVGRNGQLVTAVAGTNISATVSEAVEDPYELDPTGRLAGDSPFTHDELELLLRRNDFDSDLLTSRLRDALDEHPEISSFITSTSVNDDTPLAIDDTTLGMSTMRSLIAFIETISGSQPTNAHIAALIPTELRLGRKIDINRTLGNGVDDNSNGTIDEPAEVSVETEAYGVSAGSGQAIPNGYSGIAPNYSLGTGVSGRELFARHLYVLMMAVTHGNDLPVISNTTNAASYRARRFAQWAVNVVDYSDPDSIMTRFSFDPTPFDGAGWNPTEVVWGVETPELVLSEASAFHDVRVKDTEFDSGEGQEKNPMPAVTPPDVADDDTDQVRIPQGSLFLELYAPRSKVNAVGLDQVTKAGFPKELYDNVDMGDPVLNLSKLAPAPTGGGPAAPIWRIAISEPHFAASTSGAYGPSNNEDRDPASVRLSRRDTTSFEPNQLDELDSAAVPALTLERFVWFSDFTDPADVDSVIVANSITDMTADQVFFTPAALNGDGLNVLPGQYVSIAPRTVTHLGSHTQGGNIPDRPSYQRFQWTSNDGVVHYGAEGNAARRTPTLNAASSYTRALPLVAATFRPNGWNANIFTDGLVGLNVSEPLPRGGVYYTQPTLRYLGTAGPGLNFPLVDAYVELGVGGTTAIDTPLDIDPALNFGRIPESANPAPSDAPGAITIEPALGTIPQYCSVFLQRLADPLSPFDSVTNPYRTVDWMSVDLTVFSGEERVDKVVQDADFSRRMRQRNGFIDGNPMNALHSYETDFDIPSIPMSLTAEDYFSFSATPVDGNLHSSFNFLNTENGVANPGFQGFAQSIGSEGAPGISGTERNLPQVPFAVHPWLNRPFTTHFELMMVPACSQGRLFEEFSVSTAVPITAASGTSVTAPLHGFSDGDFVKIDGVQGLPQANQRFQILAPDPNTLTLDTSLGSGTFIPGQGTVSKIPAAFLTPAGTPLSNTDELVLWNAPFRHLLNFFHTPTDPVNTIHTARFMELVHTPPRFRGEVDVIHPARIATGDLAALLATPNNTLYDNRRNGMVNLNTISSVHAWRGLMQNHMNGDEFKSASGTSLSNQLAFDSFIENRRGYQLTESFNQVISGTGPYNYLPSHLRSEFPTEFAGVFSDSLRGGLMPRLRNTPATNFLRRKPASSGLLRDRTTFDRPTDINGASADTSRTFVRDAQQLPQPVRWTQWSLPGAALNDSMHLDRQRNPYIRYQTLSRMPNLASNNSQTYLVRLTMGFFEVDAADINSFGAEYKEASGEQQRYRAIFIIDRSIPVGFVPGQDLNARDTVVFERFYQ